ncbi:shikimate 5-dehydrogenase [Nocardia neocaledoniensis]|uniref:shikimate 5-dehydrogenase n=1 Tax=Nocardia neocaledoniensis TaxID=236511 RepID=UPI002455A484|nr:shikimate 5-dehydrogenase [Nocardia neocaledoniensis]
MPILNKDMRLCVSFAARPSNIGTRFHNYLYDELGLNYVYKAFAPVDIEQAVAGVRGLPIRGASVSMPFKEAVIPLVDRMHASATAIDSVNTIVNDDGVLTAYNTDYLAVESLLRTHRVDPSSSVLLRGSGGMAKAVLAAFAGAGFRDLTVVARNETTGRALAQQYGATWISEVGDRRARVLVNVTPLGMQGPDADTQSFADATIAGAGTVFDVVALPVETPLIAAARAADVPVITGAEVIALQAAEQFALYTGVRLTPDQVRRASEFSRS